MKHIIYCCVLLSGMAYAQIGGGPLNGGGGGSGCVTTGSGVQKGDGAGGCIPAAAGTDYVIPSGTVANTTGLNGAAVPVSAPLLGTNSLGQTILVTGVNPFCAGSACASQVNNLFTTASGLALTVAMTSSDTSLTVASTTGFPSVGMGYIASASGNEVIAWSGSTGTTLTGLTRGLYGTTASAKLVGNILYGYVASQSRSTSVSPSYVVGNNNAVNYGSTAIGNVYGYISSTPSIFTATTGFQDNVTLSGTTLSALTFAGVGTWKLNIQSGRMDVRQQNTTFYVTPSSTITGAYTSIQSAVTAAIAAGGGRVVIPKAVTPSDVIGSVTGSNTVPVFVVDENSLPSLSYSCNATACSALAGNTVNGKQISSNPVLNAFDVGSIVGPGAGSSTYYQGIFGSTAYNATQFYFTFWLPVGSTNIQIQFGNSSGSPETCGPKMTVRAAIEYPVDGPRKATFFNGARDATVDPCGIILTDPIAINTTTASQLVQVRALVQRSAGDTTAFPSNWTYGTVIGTDLSPYTTTKTGNKWDGVEFIISRSLSDGVATASSTTFTSATAAFSSLGDVGQTISIVGAGASGATLTTTIASITNSTTVVLATAATTSVSGAATTITPTDKTLVGTIQNTTGGNGYAPEALLAKPSGLVRTVGCLGDSISYGTGNVFKYGSWCTEAINFAGITAGLATRVATAIPYVNTSQPGETVANLIVPTNHMNRFSLLARVKNTMGMIGVNDIRLGATQANVQGNLVILWTQQRVFGTNPYYGTITPVSSSTTNFINLAGQTTDASNPVRIAVNAWLRAGARIDCTTALPVGNAVTSNATGANFYDTTGTVVNAAFNNCSNGYTHPLTGSFELADTVESARDSGLWAVDSGARSLTGCSITAASAALVCTSGTFTSADATAGTPVSITGAGVAGANLNTTIATFTNGTTVTLAATASTTVAGATGLADTTGRTSLTGGGTNFGDGLHPDARGHFLMATAAANVVATFTF